MTFDELLTKYKIKPQIPSQIGKGWVPLVEDLIKKLLSLKWDGHLAQCKEKFGGIRFYIGHSTEKMQKLIHEAEARSFEICENCGKKGKETKFGSWILTSCPSCAKKHRENIKKSNGHLWGR